jgi:hypothetical protein
LTRWPADSAALPGALSLVLLVRVVAMALRPASSLADWERSMRPQDLELAKTHPSYGQRLTDQVFSELCERGFAIVPNYLPEAQRADMAEALRNILPPLVCSARLLPCSFATSCRWRCSSLPARGTD